MMEFHDELPEELIHPGVHVAPLPEVTDEEMNEFKRWKLSKCRPVYGWRRCPDGKLSS